MLFNMYDGSNLQVSSISIVIFIFADSQNSNKIIFLIKTIVSLTIFSFLNYKNKLF